MRASLAQERGLSVLTIGTKTTSELLMKKNEGHSEFVLHDGPPLMQMVQFTWVTLQNKISRTSSTAIRHIRG